ncbi:hypothetical protein AVV44_gp076 [Cronobacter phage S13]|jgi:hypothetical protein|uniref:Uncharacterized protein n=1 Tax=Cronobacter phage LPCS28 TaxID=2924885 RepID=A0AAE9GBP7_9CAUD|nr:hypothetical protein AVV44_gp076 [Cronobacter phage S13]YP_010665927.1 hypothetical protein PQB73_gp097 [Cronobacter phage LPCS28]AIA64875.1 hypothetical protein S13_076 [Cronobacter phage S13]UNY47116.1 hypothetical protein EHEKIMEA_00234 [Cronobacter phage LPCS28]
MIKLEFLKAVLEWINTPWKLVGFVLATLILGGAYTVYEYRDSFIQSYISRGTVSMDTTKIPEAVSFLKERDEVNAVYVWSVDLEANRRWLVHSTSKAPEVTSYQLFTDSVQQVQIIVKLLDAQIACSNITDDNIVLNIYKQSGNYMCAVAVPPYMGKFLGIIVVTLNEEPTETVKRELMSRLKLSSATLTKTQ